MHAHRRATFLPSLAIATLLTACAGGSHPRPIEPVAHVDIDRFMGDWYVIASIPTPMEREAVNAVESYSRGADGRIDTVFRYRAGRPDGELETMTPTGFVREGSGNAVWGMRFVWPVKAEYIIASLAPDYSDTIVARSKRDYVWIMARSPSLPEARYRELVRQVAAMGYDTGRLRRVPQHWPEAQPRPPLP
ncbi:lipocalin family protein [Pseudoxanthomonas sp. 10H]|uniref:lipocalin family protein n=1 Tax=Pseudoxanthomonas sp. 10H TaxID=3242729 RepID=UPI003557AD70